MNRRDFIKLGLSAVTAGAVSGIPPIFRVTEALAERELITLNITEVWHEMVDLTQVYSYAYAHPVTGPSIPGPVIFATDGDMLRIKVTNSLGRDHGFAVMGDIEGDVLVGTGPIPPGQSRTIAFPAPPPGTYIYQDPVASPINRVLGLHGVLIVMPRVPVAGNALTPYRNPTPAVQQLFNDLGNSAHFPAPGEPWKPERTNIWVFSEIDPNYNELARQGVEISAQDFERNFLPRYFTVNGKTGYFSAEDHDNSLVGMAGEPRLIRNVHVGMDTHSPHIHANHGYLLAVEGHVQENVFWLDTWTMLPEERKDVLFPMMPPPDIPPDTWARLKDGTSQEGFDLNPRHPGPDPVTGLPRKGFPLAYPMHSHQEISQSGAGGNYPQGLIVHIEFMGTLV